MFSSGYLIVDRMSVAKNTSTAKKGKEFLALCFQEL